MNLNFGRQAQAAIAFYCRQGYRQSSKSNLLSWAVQRWRSFVSFPHCQAQREGHSVPSPPTKQAAGFVDWYQMCLPESDNLYIPYTYISYIQVFECFSLLFKESKETQSLALALTVFLKRWENSVLQRQQCHLAAGGLPGGRRREGRGSVLLERLDHGKLRKTSCKCCVTWIYYMLHKIPFSDHLAHSFPPRLTSSHLHCDVSLGNTNWFEPTLSNTLYKFLQGVHAGAWRPRQEHHLCCYVTKWSMGCFRQGCEALHCRQNCGLRMQVMSQAQSDYGVLKVNMHRRMSTGYGRLGCFHSWKWVVSFGFLHVLTGFYNITLLLDAFGKMPLIWKTDWGIL